MQKRPIGIKVGQNLKKIRTEKGISQGDICRALDMDRAYISALENGKRNPTVATLEKIAKVLGISVDQLLK
jgi:transcriptional regulator with XRE-family HTH domain